MRDAFGGAFIIKLLIIFIAIYVSMIAIALAYTKAFRIKDQIINYIEENEGIDNNVENQIDSYVASMQYYVTGVGPGSSAGPTDCYSRGYCISEMASDEYRGTYYIVTTYMQFKFPFFGLDVKVPITGETRVVRK